MSPQRFRQRDACHPLPSVTAWRRWRVSNRAHSAAEQPQITHFQNLLHEPVSQTQFLQSCQDCAHHHAPPRASPASGATASSFVVREYWIICLADDQVLSCCSAARQRDKVIIVPLAVFYLLFFRRLMHHQRLRCTQSSVPAPPRHAIPSIYISVAPLATIPNTVSYRPISQALRCDPIKCPSVGCSSCRSAPILQSHPAPSTSLTKNWYPTATSTPPPAVPYDLCLHSHASRATRHCVSAMASNHGSSPSWHQGD